MRVSEKHAHLGLLHTFGEMLQVIDFLQGKKSIPKDLKSLIRTRRKLLADFGFDGFSNVDLVIVELGSSVELTLRGYAINRGNLLPVVNALASRSAEVKHLAARWYRVGLLRMNERVRDRTSAALLQNIQGDTDEDELYRSVVRETRASSGDVLGGFRKMQDLFDCPVCAVVSVFRYMPDGRPVIWPPDLRDQVASAAQQLSIPLFDPAPVVERYGAERAISPNSRHYVDAFMPVMGEALAVFAEEVVDEHQGKRR